MGCRNKAQEMAAEECHARRGWQSWTSQHLKNTPAYHLLWLVTLVWSQLRSPTTAHWSFWIARIILETTLNGFLPLIHGVENFIEIFGPSNASFPWLVRIFISNYFVVKVNRFQSWIIRFPSSLPAEIAWCGRFPVAMLQSTPFLCWRAWSQHRIRRGIASEH